MFKKTVTTLSVAALAATVVQLPFAASASEGPDTKIQLAQCKAKKACNPCKAKKACNPCSPCKAKKACSPCKAKKACSPCKAKKK